MTARALRQALLALACTPLFAQAQQPAQPVPPDQNLPPWITRLSWFGERADFSPDGKRVVFLSKTFGDALEVELATGIIRNLTAHYPHHGYTRALYLADGNVLLSGPTAFDPADVSAARVNSSLFVLTPGSGRPAQPLGVKCSEGPAVSRRRLHIAWTNTAAQMPAVLPSGVSLMQEADLVYDAGTPKLVNTRKILDSRDVPFRLNLETQNYRPPEEKELLFSAYEYQNGEVFGIDLATGKLTNYSNAPGRYDEPEGIFPDGKFITVESDLHDQRGWHYADIYKLALDGSGKMERITHFADVPTYRASNPVVSDDGRFMAFQMARSGQAAGVGYGIFLYDFQKAAAAAK